MKTKTQTQTLYKLTDENGHTYGGTQWGPGVKHQATGDRKQDLCSDAWIHAYEHPLLAVLLNPIHAKFANPKLWEALGSISKREGQLKCGCRVLTTIREIPIPVVTTEQQIKFAIYCALDVYKDDQFVTWANNWLSGADRSKAAAWAAAWAAQAAVWAARAACAAQAAAEAAAWAAEAARATTAATAADLAAKAAAEAATAAEAANTKLDLIELAQRAMGMR